MDDISRRRFRWGVFLAWSPFLFFTVIGLLNALSSISSRKATGLGAVAGGISEALVTFGIAGILVIEVTAVVLLLRSIRQARPLRAIFSVLSLCCSALTLFFLGFFLWQAYVWLPR